MSIMNPAYTGVFFDDESVIKYLAAVEGLNFMRLEDEQKVIFARLNPHPKVTDIHEEWIGRDVTAQVIGYGRDRYQHYEAFLVQFYPTGDDEFDVFLRSVKRPVVLISKSNGKVSPVFPEGISFWGLDTTFFLTGKYGVLTKNGQVSVGIVDTKEKK